jgi:hypothetical protein
MMSSSSIYTAGAQGAVPVEQASSASVALDIGPGRGALVIYPSEDYRGREIEITRLGGDGRRVHTGVHPRATCAGPVLTAIFGSLPAGGYLVWLDEHTRGPLVTVAEGAVAELNVGLPNPGRTPP